MHREEGLLLRFWESWDGSPSDLDGAFRDLDAYLIARRIELSGG
jgi:hypothetical protein